MKGCIRYEACLVGEEKVGLHKRCFGERASIAELCCQITCGSITFLAVESK